MNAEALVRLCLDFPRVKCLYCVNLYHYVHRREPLKVWAACSCLGKAETCVHFLEREHRNEAT